MSRDKERNEQTEDELTSQFLQLDQKVFIGVHGFKELTRLVIDCISSAAVVTVAVIRTIRLQFREEHGSALRNSVIK